MERAPLCILVTGDPLPKTQERSGGFASLIRAGLSGLWEHGFVEVDARETKLLPAAEEVSGIIVTGSASSVTERAPWMLRTEAYLAEAVRAGHPVLGICFGHQLLGQALGGSVERNPRGRELGTVRLTVLVDDPLLERGIEPALVHATHRDSVTRLPPSARLLATTELEPHAAVRFGERAWGVQFHPEFDERVLRDYVDGSAEDEGEPTPEIRPAEVGRLVLSRFIAHGLRPR